MYWVKYKVENGRHREAGPYETEAEAQYHKKEAEKFIYVKDACIELVPDTEPAPISDAAEQAVAQLDEKLDGIVETQGLMMKLLRDLADDRGNEHHTIETLKVRCPVLQGNGNDCDEAGILGGK